MSRTGILFVGRAIGDMAINDNQGGSILFESSKGSKIEQPRGLPWAVLTPLQGEKGFSLKPMKNI